MAKQTAAQKHTEAHSKRRTDRLEAQTMPRIQGYIGGGVQVVGDVNGDLYRIDCENGTIRKLRWEQ